MALSNIAQILGKKKESTWLSPTWLRYQAKKQREPGPNRYQATKIEVSLLTETQAKIKILSISNQTFVEQYLLLEDTLFKTKPHMFLFL